MKPILWLFTALLLNLPATCTDQQLTESRYAEIHYIELVYQLHQADISAALLAEANLELQLKNLRPLWQRPMNRTAIDKCRSHLDEAEAAFADVRPALLRGKSVAAIVQLDRAMSEVSAADYDAFQLLFIGSMYDFYSTWREVHTIVNDQMLCLLEWKEYVWWANLARTEWSKVECLEPDPQLYRWSKQQKADFEQARTKLSEQLAAFARNIDRGGDQCVSQDYAKAVESTLWDFLLTIKAGHEGTVLMN